MESPAGPRHPSEADVHVERLGTSATQFYRLLDPANYTNSIGQLISLLEILDCEVELVVRDKTTVAG